MSLYGLHSYDRYLRGEATEEDLRVLRESNRRHRATGILVCVGWFVLAFVALAAWWL